MKDNALPSVLSSPWLACALVGLQLLSACGKKDQAAPKVEPRADKAPKAAPAKPTPAAIRKQAKAFFGELPAHMDDPKRPNSEAKVALGHALYFDTRLSKNQALSCNSCHMLDKFGVDNKPVSPGHKDQLGARNSPTVYNAALHFVQFWDGRAKDVEEQAEGPVTNPVEMAMADAAAVNKVLTSIPGYKPMFKKAFPEDKKPVNFKNMAKAIGAFERKLVTPAPFDAFLAGDDKALSAKAQEGLSLFMSRGCTACHSGNALGGQMYQKLGLLKPYPTKDTGRHEVTKKDADKGIFKVPGLRNVAKTAPYLHDGSIASLQKVVEIMAKHQTPMGELSPEQSGAIVAFLESLTGTLPQQWIKAPKLPKSGPKTPKPDNS